MPPYRLTARGLPTTCRVCLLNVPAARSPRSCTWTRLTLGITASRGTTPRAIPDDRHLSAAGTVASSALVTAPSVTICVLGLDWEGAHPTVGTPRPADSRDERHVPARFRVLPERIDPDKMVTSKESEAPGDPEAGRDTDRDFMLRYAG